MQLLCQAWRNSVCTCAHASLDVQLACSHGVHLQEVSNVSFQGLQQLQGLQELEFNNVNATDPRMWALLAQLTQLTGTAPVPIAKGHCMT